MNDAYSISQPLIRAEATDDGRFLVTGAPEVLGTVFALGEDYFLTARHVVEELPKVPHCLVIGLSSPDGFKAARVVNVEPLEADISLLQVQFDPPETANLFHRASWAAAPLDPFST